jgi:hypothetical protein
MFGLFMALNEMKILDSGGSWLGEQAKNVIRERKLEEVRQFLALPFEGVHFRHYIYPLDGPIIYCNLSGGKRAGKTRRFPSAYD